VPDDGRHADDLRRRTRDRVFFRFGSMATLRPYREAHM